MVANNMIPHAREEPTKRLVLFLLVLQAMCGGEALGFTRVPLPHQRQTVIGEPFTTTVESRNRQSIPRLHMSDVPQSDDDDDDTEVLDPSTSPHRPSSQNTFLSVLPPAPEDTFTMTGDLIALTVYGFVDHLICHDVSRLVLHRASTSIPQLERLLPATYALPVWSDPTAPSSFMVLQTAARDAWIVPYTGPLLYTGSAVVLLAACWLGVGYLLESFALSNTLHCKGDQALWVTAKTWVLATGLAAAIVWGTSDDMTLTKGDVVFLTDSLSVVTLWRFLANGMFGSSRE